MASVAGRIKSVLSPGNVQIDIPVSTNTPLNKAASQSTSLHQQCSALRSRLLRVYGFSRFFAFSSPTGSFHSSTEVVNTVWDCFALGIPLCYLFNLLPPPIIPIDIETDLRSVVIGSERAKKRAIALFAIQVKQLNHGGQFTVTDLWDRTNPGGFVKVRFTSLYFEFAQRLSRLLIPFHILSIVSHLTFSKRLLHHHPQHFFLTTFLIQWDQICR